MANKKLLSCNINELKEKIIKFYYSNGGYFNGYKSINLIKSNTEIKYTYSHSLKKNKMESIFSNEKWYEFITKIFEENIQNWKNRYYDNNICDGEQWELEMEFQDLPKFKSFGSNEYPNNWETFQKIIHEYFPKMK